MEAEIEPYQKAVLASPCGYTASGTQVSLPQLSPLVLAEPQSHSAYLSKAKSNSTSCYPNCLTLNSWVRPEKPAASRQSPVQVPGLTHQLKAGAPVGLQGLRKSQEKIRAVPPQPCSHTLAHTYLHLCPCTYTCNHTYTHTHTHRQHERPHMFI